ncbi:MAG: M23 family metallopeptidase [Candidatus Peribacteria bacterium]|jgi:murein DD-endopeptidase MepM/ murein hydrolase activator NlpD|nr:M23 family metallopeptidase [Candidatus Peribacteria bacterium]
MIAHHHKGRRVEKVYNAVHHLSNGRLHFGELCLALVFMATTYLFGNGEHLPNNTSLVYPLHQVSSLECRTQEWSVLSDNCKLTLPRIRGADYVTYQNEKVYTDIYTVLRGASYTSGRDQAVGAHYGTDIATAKGTPLYAIADGEVYSAEYNSAYGNVVKVKFKYKGEILYAVYAHMNAYMVKAGDTVKKGQQI